MFILNFTFQNEQTTKSQEILQLRSDYREIREHLDERDREVDQLNEHSALRAKEIENLKHELAKQYESSHEISYIDQSLQRKCQDIEETEKLRAEIRELREELSDLSLSEYGNVEPGRVQRSKQNTTSNKRDTRICEEMQGHVCAGVENFRQELEQRSKDFEKERITWAQEKEKVLKYQRQLQMNYVQMYRRTRALEAEVESLTIELELDKTGVKKKIGSDLTQTIEL